MRKRTSRWRVFHCRIKGCMSHAQQAVEKAIKAVLVSAGIDFPKTHNLEFLHTLLPAHVPHAPILMQVYQLTGYSTIFRYPGDGEPLSRERHQELLAIAQEAVAWAVAYIELSGHCRA